MEKIKTKVELVKKKLETIDTEHSAQIKSDCESYVSKVTITSGELHEIIDRFKQIHITTASDFKDIENQDLHNKRAFFKRRHDEIVNRLLKFEDLLQETHDSIFLTEWKALQTDFKINDEETNDPRACPRQLALFNQSSFTKSVIEEIDEKFQMRLKENENSINELQIENSKLKVEINFKKDENEKLARELDIKADHNERLIKQFEDKIKDLENKLNLAKEVNTSTPKALTGYKSDFQIPRQQNSLQVEDDKKECSEEVFGDISEELLKYATIQQIEKAVRKDFQDVMLVSPVKKKFTFKFKSFDTLKEVNKYLKKKYGSSKDCLSFEKTHSSDSNPQPPPRKKRDKGETTAAPQNPELKVEMTVQQYDKLMFFCKDNIVRSAKHNGKELILKVISQSDCKRYKDIVITEIKTIDQLSQVEIQLDDLSKKKEIEKVITDEFSEIYCKVYEKVVQLFGATYDSLQQAKHRLEIVLGTKHETKGRRGRRFADPSDNYTTPSRDDANVSKKPTNFPSESFSKSYNPSGGVSRSMEQSYSTPEGMKIKVYVGNILKLDVECIVNAANETLSHGGGVAAVISEAAGYQFDQESADYVRRHGTIPVGTCCSTSAGYLHYKYVIHTVGPRWYDYKHDEKKLCAMDLRLSIVCCFEEAEKLQLKSIALPSISAGIFGVPKEICVAEYKNAVADFSRNSKGGVFLKEIHFIDKDLGLISLIQHEFNTIFQQSSKSGSLTSPVGKKDFRRSMSSGSNDEKFQQGASVGGNRSNRFNQSTNGKIGVYVVKQKLKLEVKTGDITKCEIDGIVCPQDEFLCNLGRIAKEIEKIGGQEYKSDLLKLPSMKLTGAKRMIAPRTCPWKYVIQAIPPRWNLDAQRYPKGFEQNLKDTVINILNATKHSRIKILAVPLMGIAEKGETPVETFAEQFAMAVLKQVEDKDFTVEEIHVMVHDMNVVKKIVGVLDTKETEGIKKVLKSSHRSLPGRSEEAMEVDDMGTGDVSGGCCICMDKLDNPKTLACGHMFCTDCIEQQFKYKPSCPQCGQIHGVVTGTQPDGRMNIKTKKHSLPGYSGTNTIEIEYMIYSGKQGQEHPNPGRYFEGITRTAYLPENKKGKMVLKLLEVAFKRKLVFTIGTSTTSGKTGVVTWNDIHHKTNPKPNTQFGYPDDTYLDRVLEELAAKGITEKDLQD